MKPKLLYLGFLFPPGMQDEHPELNPAGHLFEVQLLAELSKAFETRVVSVLPFEFSETEARSGIGAAITPELCLVDRAPEVLHRRNSLARLKSKFLEWQRQQWSPDAICFYNFSPIYNGFLRWLKSPVCKRILLLADSTSLGKVLPWPKRFRYFFKPLIWHDTQMLPYTDACVGLSKNTEAYMEPRHIPWLWMPGGCAPGRALSGGQGVKEGPIRFGYFGSLAPHSGLPELLEVFAGLTLPATLHISGYGKQSSEVAQICKANPRLEFKGLLPTADDCLKFARTCDVLINPRPAGHGNENNFPSKIFEYALSGRAILTSGLSGVKEVLGGEAFYFDEQDFSPSLRQSLEEVSRQPRTELERRGAALQERVVQEFSWEKQGARMASFIKEQLTP